MNKERDYFFDNLKAVLIFLVVLGHFLLPIHGESVLVVVKRLIYVFHMPLFVFVSGYFAKKIYKNGQYNFKKILYLIKAYIIFVIAIQIVYALCGFRDFSEINFFSQSGAPWYLFAMIVWYLTIPVIRKYKEIPVLIVTVALALIAGYFKNIGDFLCMSRILVFGPFFYLGYYMEQPVLERALRQVYRRVDCRVSDFVGDYVFCAAWENLSVSDWTEYDAGIYAAPDPAGYPDVCGNL